jgi:excisionase family DNA binding protein
MNIKKEEPQLLNVRDAASFLGIKANTIRIWAQSGKLKGIKIGTRGDWRFTKEELSKMIRVEKKKFTKIKKIINQHALEIQEIAHQNHFMHLGKDNVRKQFIEKHKKDFIKVIKELAANLENLEKGTIVFERLAVRIAKKSVENNLTLEEAVDGTIFLKQAFWQKLNEEGMLNSLTTQDFYAFNHIITTYSDIVASKIAFAYHDYYKKAEEEIKKLEQQKDEFIGIASHELKTPVTSLMAYTQILAKHINDENDTKKKYLLKNINKQANRLSQLIDDLLHVNKIQSGKLLLRKKTVKVDSLINKIIKDYQFAYNTHKIIKKGRLNKNIYADPIRIEQVLVNLITNAVKYSPSGKEIVIKISENSGNTKVSVQDFGMGISEKDHKKIFERFYRSKETEESDIKGFGLGLYISWEIIKHHGGKMWVESIKGKGSTFHFTLPEKIDSKDSA